MAHLGISTGVHPHQVLMAPLWTMFLWFSVVLLWANSQWVSQAFQWPASQPYLLHGRFPACQSWLQVPVQLSQSPCTQKSISCLLFLAAVPCAPTSAQCLWTSSDLGQGSFSAIQQSTDHTFSMRWIPPLERALCFPHLLFPQLLSINLRDFFRVLFTLHRLTMTVRVNNTLH